MTVHRGQGDHEATAEQFGKWCQTSYHCKERRHAYTYLHPATQYDHHIHSSLYLMNISIIIYIFVIVLFEIQFYC